MIQATNDNVWVLRQDAETEKNGIAIPESAQKKMHMGEVVTKGELVSDKNIKVGSIAIFNKSAGFQIVEEGVEYTILTQIDIVGVK